MDKFGIKKKERIRSDVIYSSLQLLSPLSLHSVHFFSESDRNRKVTYIKTSNFFIFTTVSDITSSIIQWEQSFEKVKKKKTLKFIESKKVIIFRCIKCDKIVFNKSNVVQNNGVCHLFYWWRYISKILQRNVFLFFAFCFRIV